MSATCGDDALGAMESRSGQHRRQAPTVPVFTCTVGKKPSKAKYYVNDVDDVTDLLEKIVHTKPDDPNLLLTRY